MIKELRISMDNQITSIKNYYNILDNIINITCNHFGVKYNFGHPLAAVSWVWSHYDIWIIESVVAEDVNCIFSISVFDRDDSSDSVYATVDIMEENNKFSIKRNTENIDNSIISTYFIKIQQFIESYRNVN